MTRLAFADLAFAGKVTYRLVNTGGDLKIRVKRVDLIDADAPLDCIMGYI